MLLSLLTEDPATESSEGPEESFEHVEVLENEEEATSGNDTVNTSDLSTLKQPQSDEKKFCLIDPLLPTPPLSPTA